MHDFFPRPGPSSTLKVIITSSGTAIDMRLKEPQLMADGLISYNYRESGASKTIFNL